MNSGKDKNSSNCKNNKQLPQSANLKPHHLSKVLSTKATPPSSHSRISTSPMAPTTSTSTWGRSLFWSLSSRPSRGSATLPTLWFLPQSTSTTTTPRVPSWPKDADATCSHSSSSRSTKMTFSSSICRRAASKYKSGPLRDLNTTIWGRQLSNSKILSHVLNQGFH